MSKFLLALALVAFICTTSHAQDISDNPRVELFAGYSYLGFDVSSANNVLIQAGAPGIGNHLSLNGWDISATLNLNRWIGVEGDLGGHRKGSCLDSLLQNALGVAVSGTTCSDLSFMAGPHVTYRFGKLSAFGHGLFGSDRLNVSISGSQFGFPSLSASVSNSSFAIATGGGVDLHVTNRVSLRLGQFDYFMTRHLNNFPSVSHQNNFRVAAGIVFAFGGSSRETGPATTTRIDKTDQPARRVRSPRPIRSTAPVSGKSETSLLGVSGYATDSGFTVTSVRDGSPAAQAGIAPDDVITTIDGRPVRSSIDIERAIAASQTGIVKISYLIRGAWLTEKDVQLSSK